MATFKFHATGTKNPVKIYVHFSNGRKCRYRKPTHLTIDPKNWDAQKGKVRDRKTFPGKTKLQNHLKGLDKHLYAAFDEAYTSGIVFSGLWLEDQIDSFFNRPKEGNQQLLLTQIRAYTDYLPKKEVDPQDSTRRISASRIKHFKTLVNNLKGFEQATRKNYLISEVGEQFRDAYRDYGRDIRKVNYNTIGTELSQIKTVCNWAHKKGMKVHADILNGNFKPTKEPVDFVTLTEEEIERIKNHNFSRSPYLDNARNWLVIGCYVGARGSDLLNLTMDNVKDGYIEYIPSKTRQPIIVRLHHFTEEILDKLGGFPRGISKQKLNDYIKIVCKEVGIDEVIEGSRKSPKTNRKEKGKYPKYELISTHCFRRSFATNHYGKLPTPVLMAITGHKTEKMFLKYIAARPKDSADVLKEYWEKIKEEQGHKDKPQPKVLTLSQAK